MGMSYSHSVNCEWDGKSVENYTWEPGKCRACDFLETKRITGTVYRENYGIPRDQLNNFCLSGIKWAKCTKHTNPSCACGKIVLNGKA